MLRIYGSEFCPHCTACKKALDAEGTEYEYTMASSKLHPSQHRKAITGLIDEKHYVESRFEEVYPYIIEENEKIFLLPDCVKKHVDKISSWDCLVMEYSDPGMDVLGEDGDCFYREDCPFRLCCENYMDVFFEVLPTLPT